MSRFIKVLQKLNLINSSIEESDEDQSLPAYVSSQGKSSLELPENVKFITPKIILIPFPKEEIIGSISGYLNTFYYRKYMVWNLSEHLYPSTAFEGQVLDFVFVGYPNPPLNEMFGIFNSITGWIHLDPENVAVVHCQTTSARSYMIISSYLAWQQHKNPIEIFNQIGKNHLLFPSHIRYMSYISKAIQGYKVLLK